ncbi:MAG: PQQ-binding-like beta-propeller repeat protein [Actinomycetota bacterium]
MTGQNTTTLLRSAGAAGRILVGLSVVYAVLAIRLVVETVAALVGEDFLGDLGVVVGGGILVLVFQLSVLLALGHFSLGRRLLRGDPDGYPLATAMLVVDVLHFGVYGWLRVGPRRDVRWINAWTDHEASVRRQGVIYIVLAAFAVVALVLLLRWVRRAPGKPLPTIESARSASTQAVVVALMLLNIVVAHETVQNRRVALRVRDAQTAVDEQVRWRFSVPSSAPMATRGGGRTFFAGDDAELSAIDEMTGALMWSAAVSRRVLGIAYGAGTVFVSDLDGVAALNAATGERRWAVGSVGDDPTCVVEPAVADRSAVYVVATQRGEAVTQLQALEPATGRERWRFSWDGTSSCGSERSVAVGEGIVVVPGAGAGDGLTALNAADGRVRWHRELRGFPEGPPVVAGDSVYTTTAGGRYVYALDRDEGSIRWRSDLGPGARGPVAAGEGVVIVKDEGVVALDADDGSVRWRYRTAEDTVTPVVIAERFVYAATSLGTFVRLRALERASGRSYSCVGIAVPSDATQTIGSRDGATVVSRRAAFAIEPRLVSPSVLRTLRRFESAEHATCPVADVS